MPTLTKLRKSKLLARLRLRKKKGGRRVKLQVIRKKKGNPKHK